MTSMDAFLAHVLPTEGYYCAVILRQGMPVKQVFTSSLGKLVDTLLVNDANGHTVYHACSTFMDASSRTAQNARFVRSLWLDVDAGEGKPYADADEAAAAVVAFTRVTGLPDPVLVDSGYGLHCYWPLAANVLSVRWRALAAGLRDLCGRHGLQADHQRTCDCASILRPPATTNRKYGRAKAVTCR
jgi:hypothetical protein